MRRERDSRGRFHEFTWVPRGPAGFALAALLVAVIIALLIALSLVFLSAAIVAGIGLALYQGGKRALAGRSDRRTDGLTRRRSRGYAGARGVPPLEQYLGDVEQYDALTTRVLRLDLDAMESWRGRRRLTSLEQRAAALRESALAVERAVARDDAVGDAVRSGIWELIVAANDVHRFVCDLLDFPSTRGRSAQARELQALAERREELGRRRDELVRRLQRAEMVAISD